QRLFAARAGTTDRVDAGDVGRGGELLEVRRPFVARVRLRAGAGASREAWCPVRACGEEEAEDASLAAAADGGCAGCGEDGLPAAQHVRRPVSAAAGSDRPHATHG